MVQQRFSRRITLLFAFLFWGYAIALFIGTHLPPRHVSGLGPNDKLLHTGAYLGLSFLCLHWRNVLNSVRVTGIIAIAVLLSLFGGFDELTQPLVGRSAEWLDWSADVSGVFAGTILFFCTRGWVMRVVRRFSSWHEL